MRLTAKLVFLLVLGITILLACYGYFRVRREMQMFEEDMERDTQAMGRAVGGLIQRVWALSGPDSAYKELADISRTKRGTELRWVWLDARADGPHAPRVPQDALEPVRRGQELSYKVDRNPHAGQEGYLVTYIPVRTGTRPGAIEVSETLKPTRDYIRATIARTVTVCGSVIVLSTIGVLLLGMHVVARPLQQLMEKTRRIGHGDFSGPVQIRGHDELAELGRAINTMCEELAVSQERFRRETEAKTAAIEQLRHADRLHTVGRLASGVAHELGTPLNVILGRADMIGRGGMSPDELSEAAQSIKSQTRRITEIVQHLLDFSRQRTPNRHDTDLREVVAHTVEFMAPLARKRGVVLDLLKPEQPFPARVDASQIQQVLINLLTNAVHASRPGGIVEIAFDQHHGGHPEKADGVERDYAVIAVRDHGTGIAAEHLPLVFEPFFTTKEVGEGTGLGLSIAYGIVHEHDGFIRVDTTEGQGSCFSVYLPMEDRS